MATNPTVDAEAVPLQIGCAFVSAMLLPTAAAGVMDPLAVLRKVRGPLIVAMTVPLAFRAALRLQQYFTYTNLLACYVEAIA